MEEYIVFMRLDLLTKDAQPSPEQMQVYMKQYHDWVAGIAAKNQFAGGTGLSKEGRVITFNDVVTDGPFVEIKESIAGFIVIKASSLDEATELARACPILKGEGNSVEVRQITAVHPVN